MSEVFEFVPGEADPDLDAPIIPYVPPTEPAIPRRIKVSGVGLIRAMRHVIVNEDPRLDRSAWDRQARLWKENDLHKFMLKYEAMETAEAEKAGARQSDKDTPDMGHDEACKVLDRLLKECAK